ncbi:hypothetical protein NUACC21_79690 [Scytonema sp. NUACC21]
MKIVPIVEPEAEAQAEANEVNLNQEDSEIMEEITVTVRDISGTFKKTVDVPPEMLFGIFRQQAQEKAGLSTVPCTLVLEGKTNKVMRDDDTFQSAGIQPGAVFVLTPEAEGG